MSTTADPADQFIAYRPAGASLAGVDDHRPYVVEVADDGPRDVSTYRFPDYWTARQFVADNILTTG